jgi:hypothetical protein
MRSGTHAGPVASVTARIRKSRITRPRMDSDSADIIMADGLRSVGGVNRPPEHTFSTPVPAQPSGRPMLTSSSTLLLETGPSRLHGVRFWH